MPGLPAPEVDANSVGGLVLERLGRIPEVGERVPFPEFDVEIPAMDSPRIAQLRASPRTASGPGGD